MKRLAVLGLSVPDISVSKGFETLNKKHFCSDDQNEVSSSKIKSRFEEKDVGLCCHDC